jgi:carboxyl-terminal processing protease
MSPVKQNFKPLLVGLISIALVGGTYLLGYTVGHHNLVFENGINPKITNTELHKPTNIDFSLFWDAWNKVNDKFAGKIDNEKMVYDAINGALSSLDDPFTLFLPPDEAKRFNDDLSGSFDGIGAEIEKKDGLITVVAPLDESPALKAGVKAKDVILKIDDKETKDMSVDEAVNNIRGKKGSIVTLSIFREGEKEPLELKVARDTIIVKSVKWEIRDGNIGYIKMNMFGADTKDLLIQALDEMNAKKPKGLVLDLRNNPGGFLETAIDTTSLLTKERGAIVKEQDKAGNIIEEKATLATKFGDTPMVILVNGGSASASEIMAGALQDYGRAKLIGEKTFGKGSVQEIEPLKGGAAIRITIAKWLTPKDRQINKIGINPDIEVKLSDDDTKNNKDPQYDKAVEELNK